MLVLVTKTVIAQLRKVIGVVNFRHSVTVVSDDDFGRNHKTYQKEI